MLEKIFKIKVYRLNKNEARAILAGVQGEKCFYLNEGGGICSLSELAAALRTMPAAIYLYHANQEKNDFTNWLRTTLGDDKLADQLMKARNQKEAFQLAERRLLELQKVAGRNEL